MPSPTGPILVSSKIKCSLFTGKASFDQHPDVFSLESEYVPTRQTPKGVNFFWPSVWFQS